MSYTDDYDICVAALLLMYMTKYYTAKCSNNIMCDLICYYAYCCTPALS